MRRQVESADASADASAEAGRDTLLSTIAELARDYLQLRGTQDSMRITVENLATARETAREVALPDAERLAVSQAILPPEPKER